MIQQPLMRFDPVTGTADPVPNNPIHYRSWHGLVAWLYNPWNGKPRDPRDIASDVQGYGIIVK